MDVSTWVIWMHLHLFLARFFMVAAKGQCQLPLPSENLSTCEIHQLWNTHGYGYCGTSLVFVGTQHFWSQGEDLCSFLSQVICLNRALLSILCKLDTSLKEKHVQPVSKYICSLRRRLVVVCSPGDLAGWSDRQGRKESTKPSPPLQADLCVLGPPDRRNKKIYGPPKFPARVGPCMDPDEGNQQLFRCWCHWLPHLSSTKCTCVNEALWVIDTVPDLNISVYQCSNPMLSRGVDALLCIEDSHPHHKVCNYHAAKETFESQPG